jgi:spermidine synthase
VSARFEELAWRETPIGLISLRRRLEPALHVEIYEVKLDDDFLMSSLFTEGEIQLARLALEAQPGEHLHVLVGGLGLGYTAHAVLEDPRVESLTVVETISDVIDWHRRALLPVSSALVGDPRTRLVHGDFFDLVRDADVGDMPGWATGFDVILLDIDHSPSHHLHPAHADFYGHEGTRHLRRRLRPGGTFALWSNDPPEEAYSTTLSESFADAREHVVTFPNPYSRGESTNTIYVARLEPTEPPILDDTGRALE